MDGALVELTRSEFDLPVGLSAWPRRDRRRSKRVRALRRAAVPSPAPPPNAYRRCWTTRSSDKSRSLSMLSNTPMIACVVCSNIDAGVQHFLQSRGQSENSRL